MLLEAQGRLRLAAGDRTTGIEHLRTAGRITSVMAFGPVAAPWRSALAIALGPGDEAVALAEEELALACATGLPRLQGVALRALGVALGPSDDGVEKLRESVAILGGVAPLERARSLAELGAAFKRQNHRIEARATLDAALDLASECGAERLRERIYEELAAAGGRRRRTDEEGVRALTASELRVARLAGEGLSNVEIAQSLYISLKTVETHLSRAYAKLGLAGAGSRLQLASLLTEPETQRVAATG
jgi:DNA-binding CsgD family transcriptional regulator